MHSLIERYVGRWQHTPNARGICTSRIKAKSLAYARSELRSSIRACVRFVAGFNMTGTDKLYGNDELPSPIATRDCTSNMDDRDDDDSSMSTGDKECDSMSGTTYELEGYPRVLCSRKSFTWRSLSSVRESTRALSEANEERRLPSPAGILSSSRSSSLRPNCDATGVGDADDDAIKVAESGMVLSGSSNGGLCTPGEEDDLTAIAGTGTENREGAGVPEVAERVRARNGDLAGKAGGALDAELALEVAVVAGESAWESTLLLV